MTETIIIPARRGGKSRYNEAVTAAKYGATDCRIIGDTLLLCGDSYQILQQLQLCGQGAALCMDPPYVIETSGGGKYRKARSTMEDLEKDDLQKGFDITIINPLLFDSVVVFCHNDQLADLLPYLKGHYKRHVVLQWHKTNPQPHANRNYQADTEFFVHAWQQDCHPIGDLTDKKRWILEGALRKKPEFAKHPTVKPMPVMRKIITNLNADLVVDPFMGTGSTGVAAIEQGRRFIGIEQKPEFFKVACRRMERAVNENR